MISLQTVTSFERESDGLIRCGIGCNAGTWCDPYGSLREEVLVISGANIRTTESLIGAAVDN